MLSKGSVKKPYTVLVGLILILVLGIVAFYRMTTDLLPDINLPYVIVMTAYPGASPLQIEETVTRPVEQSMATVSNVNSIQSISQDNVSTVILEFAQSTDMDSVSLEMREHLDQVKSLWPDTVANPVIIKINPNLIPVYIAAVEKTGVNAYDLNKYVKNELSASFEAIEGVASVEVSGGVEDFVSVVLEKERVDSLNEKIKKAVEDKFKEGEDKIEDAEKDLDKAKKELEEGREQFDDGKQTAAEQIGAASGEITDGQNELLGTESELKAQLTTAQAKIPELQTQREQLVNEISVLENALSEMNKTMERIEEVQNQVAEMDAIIQNLEQLLNDPATLEFIVNIQNEIEKLQENLPNLTEEELARLEELRAQLAGYLAQLEQYGISITDVETMRKQLEELLKQSVSTRDSLNELLATLYQQWNDSTDIRTQMENTIAELNTAVATIDTGIEQLNFAVEQMSAALVQIQSGKSTLSEAVSELNVQELNGIVEMAEAAAKISVGDAQIESAKATLEESKESLKTQKELALDQADIRTKLSLDTITQILTAQHFSMPAGYVTEDNVKFLVRVGDKAKSVEELSEIVLFDPGLEGIDPIRLKDVADVIVTDNSDEVYARINGHEGILMTMQKQTGYSTGDVTGRINRYIERLSEEDPDISITALMDQGEFIDIVVNSVLQNLLFGAILAVVVLLIFLKNIMPTLVVAVSIPMSVLVAVVLMYFSGITLNIISLSGLALGVGMLVDNSIVVIENIYRLRMLGMPAKKAAVQGAKQMTGAIIASTFTTVCVFLPVVFTNGLARQLFSDLALTVTYSLIASLFIALSFIPMASSRLLKNYTQKRRTVFDRIYGGYAKVLRFCLRRKALVFIVTIVPLTVSVLLVVSKGMIFMPEMESTQGTLTMEMNDATASIKETGEMADEVCRRIESIEDITDIGAMISAEGTMSFLMENNEDNTANMYLLLNEDRKLSNKEVQDEILKRTQDLDCHIKVNMNSLDTSALGGSGISVMIKGRDLDVLRDLAEDIGEIIGGIDGVKDVDNGLKETLGELRITVDKEKAAKYDLMVYQVFQLVNSRINEQQGTSTLSTDTDDYDIVIYDESHNDYTREDVRNMTIPVTDKEGKTKEIPLSEIVTFEDGNGFSTINRAGQSRNITIMAEVGDDANITLVSDEITAELESYDFPEGYTYEMSGEDVAIRDALKDIILMIVLGILLMYLIMVAQFQSFKAPFIVMFTVPLAFTGGFMGLLAANMTLSIIALVGLLMLSGIIVNNGIVLVDYINQLRISGMERTEAIVKAGSVRMRPIIMTALTTILGLIVMALGVGTGADMTQPMAVVTIGGLTYGTFMTLFLVPCIYDIFMKKDLKSVSDEEIRADEEDLELMKETNYI